MPGISAGLKNALTKSQQVGKYSQEDGLQLESSITANPKVDSYLQSTPVKDHPVCMHHSGEDLPVDLVDTSHTDFGNGSQEKGVDSLQDSYPDLTTNNLVRHTSTESSLYDMSTVIEVETSSPEHDEGTTFSMENVIVSPVGSGSDVPLLAGEDNSVSGSGWGRSKDKNRRDRLKGFEKKLSAGKMV